MIVVETVLRDIFSQIPNVVGQDGKSYKVNFEWGGLKDLNLYLKQKTVNVYPLIWLVQGKQTENDFKHTAERRIKLIIAKNSNSKTAMNPKVWDTEFVNVLNPLLDKVKKCLNSSGVTDLINGELDIDRRANYTEKSEEDETYAIDFWNVIVIESLVRFSENPNGTPVCINTIKF